MGYYRRAVVDGGDVGDSEGRRWRQRECRVENDGAAAARDFKGDFFARIEYVGVVGVK